MPRTKNRPIGPGGGLTASAKQVRPWRWERDAALLSRPIPCKKEEWHLIRAACTTPADQPFGLSIRYLADKMEIGRQAVSLLPSPAIRTEQIGWFLTPPDATHFQVHLDETAAQIDTLLALPAGGRDPVCHPAANVPRWSVYQRTKPVERILLPSTLESLQESIRFGPINVIRMRGSFTKFLSAARHSALILDPAWVAEEGLTWQQLQRLAEDALVLVDLESAARLAASSAGGEIRSANYRDRESLFSAKNEYADTATRGFALQDIFPCCAVDEKGGFQARTIRHTRDWQRFADENAIATLLSCQTPWEGRVKDVLSAAMPTARGDLILTDLPWLVAGQRGALLAPRLAQHLLNMHLGGPLPDETQYWNRWDETHIVIRDIADMTRRYPGLQPVRYAPQGELVTLGLSLTTPNAQRHLLIETGRIDLRERHDGVPPEPLMIVMRWLERRHREQAPWTQRRLARCAVTWCYTSAAGRKYATMYSAAAPTAAPTHYLRIRMGTSDRIEQGDGISRVTLRDDVGILGDGSLGFVERLMAIVTDAIESASPE